MSLHTKYAAWHNDWELGVRRCMKRIWKKLSDSQENRTREIKSRSPIDISSSSHGKSSSFNLSKCETINIKEAISKYHQKKLQLIGLHQPHVGHWSLSNYVVQSCFDDPTTDDAVSKIWWGDSRAFIPHNNKKKKPSNVMCVCLNREEMLSGD